MIETALVVGIFAVLITWLIYNTRVIADIKSKVDLIYKNINIAVDWINNNNHKRK